MVGWFVAGRGGHGDGAGEQISMVRRHEPGAAPAEAEADDENRR
jgi:hypothetical protein